MNRQAISRDLSVFFGFYEISGYSSSLKKGFDELGVPSYFIELNDHPFRYTAGMPGNWYLSLLRFFGNKSAATPASRLMVKISWQLCQDLLKVPLFLWALAKYNTFIFVFGVSFFYLLDLPVLKLFRKKVVFIFLGSDSRPPYLNGKYFDHPANIICRISARKKKAVRTIDRYADIIIDNPASSHYHERPVINSLLIGFPLLGTYSVKSGTARRAALRVLHAPSTPRYKGTDVIRSTIESLRSKGHRIELIEIIDRPNAEVHSELARCDFVIDELYSDAIMSGFASEAAQYAKPTIVCGYPVERDWGFIPPAFTPPVHHCRPDQVEAAIEKLIVDDHYRLALGARAREFVRAHWTAHSVAGRFVQLLRNDFPASWLYDPQGITYLHGWGLSDAQARELIRRTVLHGGSAALHVQDKPELEALLIAFAGLAS